MADIDHFKRFNDDFGHNIGDIALQKVAAVLKAPCARATTSTVTAAKSSSSSSATPVPTRRRCSRSASVLQSRRRRSSTTRGAAIGPITISIGVAQMPVHGKDVAALIELADVAMYKAKSTGRNRVVLWDDDMATRKGRRLTNCNRTFT